MTSDSDLIKDTAEELDEDKKSVQDNPLFGLQDAQVKAVTALLDAGKDAKKPLQGLLDEMRNADIADLFAKLHTDQRENLINQHGESFDPNVYAEIDHDLRPEIIDLLPTEQVANIVDELDSDDALDLIISLEEERQDEIIRQLSAKTRMELKEGLNFPEDSAGRLMQREFVAIPQFWTVGKTIDYLRAAAEEIPDEFFDIFVITPTYHVAGEIPLSRLIKAKRSEKLESLTLDDIHAIPADSDQEDVARIFRRENIASAPVVDDNGRLIGVVTVDDVIHVIDEEAEEDFLKLGGIEEDDLYRAVLSTTGSRFRWLFVNLLTAIFASMVIALFETTIEKVVALAILMPIVASMGGNAGTQALTVAVRALSTKELTRSNTMRIIWKETLVGFINGALFAILIGAAATLWFQDIMLGGVIAAAMIINLLIAGLFGAGIPIMLDRMGSDPAISSTVILTTATDVIGFFAFLGLAALLLV
ncbi:MAG: magnesium transporter [Pseudomonadota bacterium]|nr:magnesium transporter [Pseudomonadota bacterium]MEC9236339.1 magnesium transporter [Pseudomonadota bacterium]